MHVATGVATSAIARVYSLGMLQPSGRVHVYNVLLPSENIGVCVFMGLT